MLSRKDLNSAELETVRVSRNTTTVITASEEVQTNEDATRDLDLFLTVQLLEDTPPTIFRGHFREDHGVAWSGWKIKHQIFSTKGWELHWISWSFERSFKLGLCEGNCCEIQYDGHRHMNGCHQVARCETCQNCCCFLPESWWAQMRQPRNAKHVFFRNHVVPFLYSKRGSRKRNVFTHFPKDPNFEVRRRNPKLRGFRPCRRRTKNVIHHAVKFVDLITADHKILNEEVNRAILTGMQWLCRTWPLSG